ncbi:MAG: hypothetical protein WCF92_01975 [bacterium]
MKTKKQKSVTVEGVGSRAIITVYNTKGNWPSILRALAILKVCATVDIVYTPELERNL